MSSEQLNSFFWVILGLKRESKLGLGVSMSKTGMVPRTTK